jgi:hypothetical protein
MGREPGLKWKSLGTKGARRVGAGVIAHHAPALSPDGTRLLFAVGEGGDSAWVLGDRRGRVARVLPGPAVGGATISSMGALAFTRAVRPASEVWWAPSPSLPAVRLLGGDGARYSAPAFSPDGRTLACVMATDVARLVLVDLESLTRREVVRGDDANGTRDDARPTFSPDGTLLFVGRTGGEVAIYCQAREMPPERVCSGIAVAPVLPNLIVVERPVAGDPTGASRLYAVELERGQVARERELCDDDAREPTVAWAGARTRLAWVTLVDGLREIVVARLRGVTTSAHEDPAHEGDDHDDGDDDDADVAMTTQARAITR